MAILKIPRFWSGPQLGRAAAVAAEPMAASGPARMNGLEAFGSEAEPVVHVPPSSAPLRADRSLPARSVPSWVPSAAKWFAVIALTAGVAIAGVLGYQRRFPAVASTGTVSVETVPAGLEVVLAGKTVGQTPLTLSLAPGGYDLKVGPPGRARAIPVRVSAGSSLVHRLEFGAEGHATAATRGGLKVQTEPSNLPVLIDGKSAGVSPTTVDDLAPGEHEVLVRTAAGVVRRTVAIQAGETLSLLVSSVAPVAGPAAVSAGWMTVSSAVSLQLREGGKLIGTTDSDRLMLPAGDHDIEFTNAALGFTTRRVVRVAPGKTAAIKIDLPSGSLSVNAQPWAEVWIDGERVGETPVGNLSRTIGSHEIVFRHPELGERRETVVVTVGKPARIGVDLRKK